MHPPPWVISTAIPPVAGSSGGGSPAGGSQDAADFVAGQLIVLFADGVSEAAQDAFIASQDATLQKRLPIVRGAVVELDTSHNDVLQVAADWVQYPEVSYAEPNFVLTVDQTFPDDPSWPSLWGMHNTGQSGGTVDADVDAPEAWDLHTGSADVVVAVIDTGIDYDHPDLADNMWTNLGECPGGVCTANGIDDDGNGYVDDFHGIDTAFNDSDPFDGQGHGTHVAGTIGAVGNNGIGVAGINWDVQLMALKFLNDSGSGATSDAIEALDYMVRMRRDYDVNVVASNNSWSGGGYSQALVDAIQAGVDEGILFVAAAGNDGQNNDAVPSYPSSYGLEGIISVAATDRFDQLAYFSNYGAQHVDLSAPGVSILSTTPGGNYSTLNGTSMATPHVTGAVALLASAAPGAGVMELKDAILNSVEPLPALQGKTLTEGRLNVARALRELGDPGDHFAIEVAAGDTLLLQTLTPGRYNNLDPMIELYDTNGALVDTDDNGAADGRNSHLSHTASQAGTYQVRVLSAGGTGEYLLQVAGNSGVATNPGIEGTSPADGQVRLGAPQEMTVYFSDTVLATSLSRQDLLVDGKPAVSLRSQPAHNVAVFELPELNEGTHTFQILAGTVNDIHGRPFDGISGAFEVDTSTHPISTSDLVAYWAFDEGMGTTASDSAPHGENHAAVLQGNVMWNDFGRQGSIALEDDGSFVDVLDASDLNASDQRDRSISLWFNAFDPAESAHKQVLFEEGGSVRGLNIYLHDGRLYVGGWNTPSEESGWSESFLSTPLVQPDQWHHVTVVLDGDRTLETDALTAYLDGQLIGSAPASRIWTHTGDMGIGRVDGANDDSTATTKFHTGDITENGHEFVGLLDEIRIYNRVLTSSEVQLLASQSITDPQLLSVDIAGDWMWENSGVLSATVSRIGDLSVPLEISLSSSDATEASVPATITMVAGQTEESFLITAHDDLLADGAQQVAIRATAAGYLPATDSLLVADDEPPVADLVAHWMFDEGVGGTAGDSSPLGADHSATLWGDALWNEFGSGGSLALDGTGDFVDVPDSDDLNTQVVSQRTVAGWFLVEDAAVNDRKQVIYEQGGVHRGLNIYLHDGQLYVGGWNTPTAESGWAGTFLTTGAVPSGTWHHVALVLDGNGSISPEAIRGYLDGVPFGSGPGSQVWAHTGDIGIGQATGVIESVNGGTKYHTGNTFEDGDGLRGLVDDFRVYNRALSDQEINVLSRLQMVQPLMLEVDITEDSLLENGGPVTAMVRRTGDTQNALQVALSSSDTTEATVTPLITLAAGVTEATFVITPHDDELADGTQQVLVTATAADYIAGQDALLVLDNEPTDDDLIAHWTMNDSSGTTVLDTAPFGADHSGVLTGDAMWNEYGDGGSLSFDGQGDYVAVPDSSDLNTSIITQRTVSAWLNANDVDVSSRKQVVFEEGGSLRGLNIYVHDGQLYLGGWNTPTTESGWSGTFLSTDQIESQRWHHVALVLEGDSNLSSTGFRAYLDGALIGTGLGSQLWSHTGDTGIGQVTGFDESTTGTTKFHTGDALADGHGFEGMIDEVRVYNRALTAGEVASLADLQLVQPRDPDNDPRRGHCLGERSTGYGHYCAQR